jgi:RNA polymerase sigma-70 factor (ECF subfamily)
MGRAVFVTGEPARYHSSKVTVRADLAQPELLREPGEGQRSDLHLAFETIYEQHFDLVWRTLARLGVASAALDDALQDVFLVVHRRLPEFESRSSLRTWIFGITLRVASEYVRRGRREQHTSAPISIDVRDEHAPDPLEQRARSEAVALLYAALAALDPEKRAAFVLAELEEMSLAEVAAVVGANVNTVSSRVKAARRQFEAALRRLRAKDDWRSRT